MKPSKLPPGPYSIGKMPTLTCYSFALSWKMVTGNDLWPPRSLVWQNVMFYCYINRFFFFRFFINFTCSVTMFVVLRDKVNKQLSLGAATAVWPLARSFESCQKSPLPCSVLDVFVLVWSKSGNRKCSLSVDILPVVTAFWFIIQKYVINFSSHVKFVD